MKNDYNFKQIQDNLDVLRKSLEAHEAEIVKLKKDQKDLFKREPYQDYLSYPKAPEYRECSYGFGAGALLNPNYSADLKKMTAAKLPNYIEQYEKYIQEVEVVRLKNDEITATNSAIGKKNTEASNALIAFLKNIGLPSEKTIYVRNKAKKEPADWIGEVASSFWNKSSRLNEPSKSSLEGTLKALKEELKRHQDQAAAEAAKNGKIALALKFLEDLKIEKIDLENPVKQANDVAWDEAMAYIKEKKLFIEHSCCDTCSEWDPDQQRCSCGNRRMTFDSSGWSFEKWLNKEIPHVEAY